jgi:hypothetical protein
LLDINTKTKGTLRPLDFSMAAIGYNEIGG